MSCDILREHAIRHAYDAFRHKDYWEVGSDFSVVQEGYRYDDPNGISVFLSYDGKIKAICQ